MIPFALAAPAILAACLSPSPTDPSGADFAPTEAVSLDLQPRDPVVMPGQTVRFSARLRDASGKSMPGDIEWQVEDGVIDSEGVFVAGDRPGRKKVKALQRGRKDVADSTWVDVGDPAEAPPVATKLEITPDFVTVETRDTVDFYATLYAADGSRVAGEVNWVASGGSIDQTGRFIATAAVGDFEIEGRAGELSDTSSVVVEEPPADDPPSPPANVGPAAAFSPTCTDLACSFDAGASSDTDGTIVSYAWTFGDGTSGSGKNTSHTFASAGSYDVRLTVRDDDGATTQKTKSVTATEPSAPPAPPLAGKQVSPGQNIQALVDANPNGTVFVLKAGVHASQQVRPKNGNVFQGEPGAVLDGQGLDWAIKGSADDVVIRGLEIRNYATPEQRGTVEAEWDQGLRWIVEDNEIHGNGGAGLYIGHDMIARRNHIHHNGQFGLLGFGNRALIVDNEISYNNTGGYDPLWAAGGMKFFYSTGITFRGNYVHHNFGPGVWFDHDNSGILIENNRVEDNQYSGIYYEVNPDGVIRNNTILRNGTTITGTWTAAGIVISESRNVEVTGNTLAGNGHGIMAVQQDRSAVSGGPWLTENVWVHDNDVTMQEGGSGLRDIVGGGGIYTRNNRFDSNTYRISGNAKPFWLGSLVTESSWKSAGQDTNSTFIR